MKDRILITGSTGFIGSHLIPKLVDAYDVYALNRYVTGRFVMGENVKTVFADLRNYSAVERAVKMVHPDYVIHLAAISAVSYSYNHPQEVTRINYLGLINLVEAIRKNVENFQQFIAAGTSEEYGNQTMSPITEEATLNPNSAYAVSKAASSLYLFYMKNAYDFPMTIMRPFNTYGRKRNMHFVTERILTQMLTGQEELRLGDPDPIRDLLYVDDHVEGYLKALGKKRALGEAFNICTGEGVTIRRLVELCQEVTEWDGVIKWNTIPKRPLDIDTLIGSANKAAMTLGWLPKVSLPMGLHKTAEHWKKILEP